MWPANAEINWEDRLVPLVPDPNPMTKIRFDYWYSLLTFGQLFEYKAP